MIGAGENSWWKKAVSTGEIRGAVMQNREIPEGTLVWPWGEKPGACTKDDYVDYGEERICNAALVRWEGESLTVKSPDGGIYRFKQPKRVPVTQDGNHDLSRDADVNGLLLKDPKDWPGPDACIEFYQPFTSGLAPLAVREVVAQLHTGAGRCFEIPVQIMKPPTPPPAPEAPLVVAEVETPPAKPEPPKVEAKKTKPPAKKPPVQNHGPAKPKPRTGLAAQKPSAKKPAERIVKAHPPKPEMPTPEVRRTPTTTLKEMCKKELPQNGKKLWEGGHVPRFAELEHFRGYRCGFLYQQGQKGTDGIHTPEMGISFKADEVQMTLQTKDGPQRFMLQEDTARIWAQHVNPNEWMIPPNMSLDGNPHGTYGPIELRILQGGELMLRYLIPSNDGKDYVYGWAIARAGVDS